MERKEPFAIFLKKAVLLSEREFFSRISCFVMIFDVFSQKKANTYLFALIVQVNSALDKVSVV
ncbi:MAG: hypothetical protein IKH59_05515 [Bacteroidaceae bacterium]|nr:hypothetical protein [Bacteroidaceae bacterium]